MVPHHTIGEQPNSCSSNRFLKNSLKCLEIIGGRKDRRPRVSTVQNVVNPTTRCGSFWSSHAMSLPILLTPFIIFVLGGRVNDHTHPIGKPLFTNLFIKPGTSMKSWQRSRRCGEQDKGDDGGQHR